MDSSQYVDIVTKVDQFYNSAWSKLMTYGAILALIIGVVFPVIVQFFIQWNQSRKLKLQELKILNKAIDRIDKKFEEELKIINAQLLKIENKSFALTYHIQGNIYYEQSAFLSALECYILASKKYLECKDFLNLPMMLTGINNCLPQVEFHQIEAMAEIKKINLKELLQKLDNREIREYCDENIRKIRETLYNLGRDASKAASK